MHLHTSQSPFARLGRPCLMGVLNVTPDSFSDGGIFLDPRLAARHARSLAIRGAQIIDLGAEASSFFRPGIIPVPADEQIQRLLPVLEELRSTGLPDGVVISVDTRSAAVADAVLANGARIINDISGAMHEPAILDVIALHRAAVILMHLGRGFPATPAADAPDIIAAVKQDLRARAEAAANAGIPLENIAVDPGIGFGKSMADNWRLAFGQWADLAAEYGGGVAMGASRKRFLETPAPADVRMPGNWEQMVAALRQGAEHPRDGASAAVVAVAAARGVGIHRVHDAGLARRAWELAGQLPAQ